MATSVRRVTRNVPPADESPEEAEPEAPKSRFSRGPKATPSTGRGRRSAARDDDDESDDGAAHVTSGWGGYKRAKDTTPQNFDRPWRPEKGDEEEYLFKFLEDAPYATFKQHWYNRSAGQMSFICLDDDCPMCEDGNRPSAHARFNVAISLPMGPVDDDDPDAEDVYEWVQKTFDSGINLTDALVGYSNDRKIGPLSKGYFAIQRTGEGKKTKWNVRPVKARDLTDPDDWNTPEPTPEQLKKFEANMFDKTSLGRTTRRDMLDLIEQG